MFLVAVAGAAPSAFAAQPCGPDTPTVEMLTGSEMPDPNNPGYFIEWAPAPARPGLSVSDLAGTAAVPTAQQAADATDAIALGVTALPAAAAENPTVPTLPVLVLENPNPGDLLGPGDWVLQGIAYDPAADGQQGSGIDRVTLTLDDRDQGGSILGEVEMDQPNPEAATPAQLSEAGFTILAHIPNHVGGGHRIFAYAHSSLTGRETVLSVPIVIGAPS
ncbi:MAG: hypothetical protein NVSMB2_04200 [Chloroflexota bacterium]